MNYSHFLGLFIGVLIGFIIGFLMLTENSIGIGVISGAVIGEIFGLAIVLGDSDIQKEKTKVILVIF